MEKIGKVEIKSSQERLQKYLATCPTCGAVLVFTENDLHSFLDYKRIVCPDCNRNIIVMTFIPHMGRLILQKDVKRISLKKYKKLKAKFAEPPTPPTYMPEKIVTERPKIQLELLCDSNKDLAEIEDIIHELKAIALRYDLAIIVRRQVPKSV